MSTDPTPLTACPRCGGDRSGKGIGCFECAGNARLEPAPAMDKTPTPGTMTWEEYDRAKAIGTYKPEVFDKIARHRAELMKELQDMEREDRSASRKLRSSFWFLNFHF